MYEDLQKVGPKPDVCVCGSDLIAQEVLNTIYKHNIAMHVICDVGISARSIWLTTQDNFAKLPGGGSN